MHVILKDKKLLSVHIYCMGLTSFSNCIEEPGFASSSIHSLRILMTSYLCNKYEQIMPPGLLSVKYVSYEQRWKYTGKNVQAFAKYTCLDLRNPQMILQHPPLKFFSANQTHSFFLAIFRTLLVPTTLDGFVHWWSHDLSDYSQGDALASPRETAIL